MHFFSKLKNYIEEIFLRIDIFFQKFFFGSKHKKPEDFEASIILEKDSIIISKLKQPEDDTFEILSDEDIIR
jgi:hypothetical protein